MKKLFHEVAMQPESILRDDAITLMREVRLDHSRYIQDLPTDWFIEATKILKNSNLNDSHKKMAMLERLKPSIIKTRSGNYQFTNEKWREHISLFFRDNPFDLQVYEKEIIYNGSSTDLDSYLETSEIELGSLNMPFKNPNDWFNILQPIIMSDNSIAIVDRYFDLDSPYYSKLFIEFLYWLKKSRVTYLRIFIGPKSSEEIRNELWKSEFNNFCAQAVEIINRNALDLVSNIVVSSCTDLHLRYFGSKICGIELDYGFRLSGSKNYKITLMRQSSLNDFRSRFFSQISGSNYLSSKCIWPPRKSKND